jgi:membrane protease YdiL (CAAX protease family)
MNIKIKPILPSLLFLFLGIFFFFLIRALPFTVPPELNSTLIMSLISCVFLFWLSKFFLSHENINLSTMNLIPNNKTFLRLAIGLVIGVIITGTMLYTLFTLTNLDLQRVESQSFMLFLKASLIFIPLALMEELLFRGYPFFRLSQLINIRWTILITATLFALYHFNGSSSISTLLLGPGIWGVTFGVAAYLSKSIAAPLGIHISANVLQAQFGMKSSYVPMWELTNSTNLATTIEPDQLGIIMQLLLLIFSIIVLEFSIRKKKSTNLKIAKA